MLAGDAEARLHAWSLRTGAALPPRAPPARDARPVRAMEVVEEARGAFLWAARGECVSRIELGPRGLLRL